MHKVRLNPILFLILIALTLSACRQAAPSPATATTTATLQPTATPTETPHETALATQTPTPTPSATVETVDITEAQLPNYQLTALLKYVERYLSVNEIISYTNTTGTTLDKLPLIIPPAKKDRGFSLTDLVIHNTQEPLQTDCENTTFWITLPEPLEPNELIQIELSYALRILEGRNVLGWTDRQLLLSDWYPFIPPWLPQSGWLINQPSTVGEYLNYPLAQYDVYLTYQSSTPLVVAASLPLNSENYGNLFYTGKAVRNVTFAFSPEYLEYTRETDDVTIAAYLFPEHAELGQRAADLAAEAWSFYEDLYGDNPRQYMAIIEADLNDGMEYDGAFLLSQDYFASADATPQNYFELLIVHETAHQWFYAQVANDQANEPWLDEAFATYSELLYLENNYPDLVSWWWNYRVYAYQPMGWVDSSIYGLSGFRPYVNAVYLRGVQFLDDLREQIGDDAFFAVLQEFATPDENDTFHSTQGFFDLVAANSQENLTDLQERYFRNTQP